MNKYVFVISIIVLIVIAAVLAFLPEKEQPIQRTNIHGTVSPDSVYDVTTAYNSQGQINEIRNCVKSVIKFDMDGYEDITEVLNKDADDRAALRAEVEDICGVQILDFSIILKIPSDSNSVDELMSKF